MSNAFDERRGTGRPRPDLRIVRVTGGINWYRNLDRNWHLLADVEPIIKYRALMIYGDRDVVPRGANLTKFVPNVEVVSMDCGHWIQQEKPEETDQAILGWLDRHGNGMA